MPFFETGDRTRLYFVDGGSGRPVVFVASAWLSSRMWEFQLPAIVSGGFRCVAYDRRGHGRSDWPWDGYDYDTLADDLAALLTHLDLRGVTLVGHSMGGGEIVRYLTRHGASRVAQVVLVAATAPFPMKTDDNPLGIDRLLMEADMASRVADRPAWFANNAPGFFALGEPETVVSPDMVQYLSRQCLDCSPRAADQFFLAGFTADLRAEMRGLTAPTLIVHGDRDAQAPVALCGRRSAALLPNARMIEYAGAAHGLFVTHAARLNTDLLAFAREVPGPAEASEPAAV